MYEAPTVTKPDIFEQDALNAFGAPARPNLLDGLNEDQQRAVQITTGPLRILAGAGTGKTTVLIKRIINILNRNEARPQQIMAVTFTNKAANEMRARLANQLGSDVAALVHIGTFHAIASKMLRAFSYKIDLSRNYTLLDDSGQKQIVINLASRLGLLDSKKNKELINKYHSQIMSWKEEGYTVQDVISAPDLMKITNSPLLEEPELLEYSREIFKVYQTELMKRNYCDYADLILHMVRIFREFPYIEQQQAARFRHILVDEFQDTSPMQYEFVSRLAKNHNNICVVGDIDQSIYQWRSAKPSIMLNFPKVWPNCQEVTIDTNYRSSQEILDISNTVVAPLRAKDGLDKLLTSSRHGTAPKDLFQTYDSAYEEADTIASSITEMTAKGVTPSEIAILCRSGLIIRGIETSLRRAQIKYIVAGAQKFTEREEIKDAIAWLSLAINPQDYISLDRIASKPSRGLGPQKINNIKDIVIREDLSIRDAAHRLAMGSKPTTKAHRDYLAFADLLDVMQSIAINGSDVGDMLHNILSESGYLAMRENNEKDDMADLRMENIDILIKEARDYITPQEFLEVLALQSSSDKAWDQNSVVVSTVHASKGLEFDHVFCPAMEEGVFPNARSEKTPYGPDEERRLAHVAWTRARQTLHISYALDRMGTSGAGLPSKFLAEAGLLGFTSYQAAPVTGSRIIRPRNF